MGRGSTREIGGEARDVTRVLHGGLELATHPEVYEPAEDSWLLLDVLRDLPLEDRWAVDVGTGTGVQAIGMAREGAEVVAVDVNPHAVGLARGNAARNGVGDRVHVVRGNLLDPVGGIGADLVVFNAPYLPSEASERLEGPLDQAFHGGVEGVEVAQALVMDLPRVLNTTGLAYLVLSTRGNVEAVTRLAANLGFRPRKVAEDAFFFERVQVWRLGRR